MAKKRKGTKRVFETSLHELKTHAIDVEKNLLEHIGQVKDYLKNIKAEIKDSRLTVDANNKGEVEIEFAIKAVLKKR